MSKEVEISPLYEEDLAAALEDALVDASDQDQITYIMRSGRRVAAVVPVDVAEEHDRKIAEVLRTPVAAGPARFGGLSPEETLKVKMQIVRLGEEWGVENPVTRPALNVAIDIFETLLVRLRRAQ